MNLRKLFSCTQHQSKSKVFESDTLISEILWKNGGNQSWDDGHVWEGSSWEARASEAKTAQLQNTWSKWCLLPSAPANKQTNDAQRTTNKQFRPAHPMEHRPEEKWGQDLDEEDLLPRQPAPHQPLPDLKTHHKDLRLHHLLHLLLSEEVAGETLVAKFKAAEGDQEWDGCEKVNIFPFHLNIFLNILRSMSCVVGSGLKWDLGRFRWMRLTGPRFSCWIFLWFWKQIF